MTDLEKAAALLALPPGAVVEVRNKKDWIEARVFSSRAFPSGHHFFTVDPAGLTPAGNKRPRRLYYLHVFEDLARVRLKPPPPSAFARQQGNVFADFLEEHGEAKAAALLREAFPLIEKEDV